MEKKISIRNKYNARVVFEIDQQTKDDLQRIAKSNGETSADVLRELTVKFVTFHKKRLIELNQWALKTFVG